jgi:hypothetical protein
MIPNILTSISGLPKTGKTHLSMTWPAPVKVFSFDQGADFVRSKFPDDKVIDVQNFVLPLVEDENMTWASPVWDDFYAAYKEAVEGDEYQTVVIDTATAAEAVLRQAVLEWLQDKAADSGKEKKRLATNEYQARNLRMKAIFDNAKIHGVNLVTIQYLGEKWAKTGSSDRAQPTGELILQGWNQTEGMADVNIEMETKAVKVKGEDKTIMVATIKSNRFDREMNGKSFNDTSYDEIVALLFGENGA